MKKILFASAVFTTGAVFGLAIAAVVALGLLSFGSAGAVSVTGSTATPDVTVRVSERHINSLVQKQIGSTTGYQNVRVKVEPGNVLVLTGDANVGGIQVPVQVKSQLFVDNEGIGIKVVETKAGVLPIKVDLSSLIEEPVAAASRSVLPLNHYRVSKVATEAGYVTVEMVERQ